ncbi:MAG: hypothetical protein ACRD2S_10365 [Terriglobales bacterium]
MKLFLSGGLVGFLIGALTTIGYFSLATLFAANARFLATKNHLPRVSSEKEPNLETGLPAMELKTQATSA